MLTRLMVIQKIDKNGKVSLYQISSNFVQWTFETTRTKTIFDTGYFPFRFGKETDVLKKPSGPETITYIRDEEIIFCDDYGIPGGTLVGVLYPKNFIPDIIKFKDKPYIPVGFAGQVSTTPPGHIQILYNYLEKQCAIVFSISRDICFGFKSVFKKVEDKDFPRNESFQADDLFDITLSTDLLNVESISNDNLKIINEALDPTKIEDIHKTLNELLISVKSREKEKSRVLLERISRLLSDGVAATAGLTSIADSYRTGGAIEEFITKIIKYTTL